MKAMKLGPDCRLCNGAFAFTWRQGIQEYCSWISNNQFLPAQRRAPSSKLPLASKSKLERKQSLNNHSGLFFHFFSLNIGQMGSVIFAKPIVMGRISENGNQLSPFWASSMVTWRPRCPWCWTSFATLAGESRLNQLWKKSGCSAFCRKGPASHSNEDSSG